MVSGLIRSTKHTAEGIARIRGILRGARDRYNLDVRSFADSLNEYWDTDEFNKNQIVRLEHVGLPPTGNKNLKETYLRYYAPFTWNPDTGRPYTERELIAIARGEMGGQVPLPLVVANWDNAPIEAGGASNVTQGPGSEEEIDPAILAGFVLKEVRKIGLEEFAQRVGLRPKVIQQIMDGSIPGNAYNKLLFLSRHITNPESDRAFSYEELIEACKKRPPQDNPERHHAENGNHV